MSVLRFDPFRDVDRLTEQLLGVPSGSQRAPRFMPMDLFKSGDHYVLLADLPGVDPGTVDVSVDNGTLTIRAERSGRGDDAIEWISSERFTGSYMRQLSLGEGINSAEIAATYENGVLSVSIPLAERARPRKIDVATSNGRSAISGTVKNPSTEVD